MRLLREADTFFLHLPPSLPLSPDSQPQSPVILVLVIGAIFPKFKSALNRGNMTQASSLVDLVEGFVAVGLCEGTEASSTRLCLPRAWEGLPLAVGGLPLLPAAQETHDGTPHPPQSPRPFPSLLALGHSQNQHTDVDLKVSLVTTASNTRKKHPQSKLSRIESRQQGFACQLKAFPLLPSNASKHRRAHAL